MILTAGNSCRGVDNKIAMEYRNCTYHVIERPKERTIVSLGRTHCLDHLAPGVEIYNHDRLDLISEGQVCERASASEQDCNGKHAMVEPQSAGDMILAAHRSGIS